MRNTKLALAVLAGLTLSSTSQAELQGRDLNGSPGSFEAYYDNVLGITWLADANYAKTSGYDLDGYMKWGDAKTWAGNLDYYGITGWRLPVTGPVNGTSFHYFFDWSDYWTGARDYGYDVSAPGSAYPGATGSELAYMYYNNLGNKAYRDTSGSGPQPGWGLQNTGPFANLQNSEYWSGTEYAPDTYYAWYYAWVFDMDDGFQDESYTVRDFSYAWAVRPGE